MALNSGNHEEGFNSQDSGKTNIFKKIGNIISGVALLTTASLASPSQSKANDFVSSENPEITVKEEGNILYNYLKENKETNTTSIDIKEVTDNNKSNIEAIVAPKISERKTIPTLTPVIKNNKNNESHSLDGATLNISLEDGDFSQKHTISNTSGETGINSTIGEKNDYRLKFELNKPSKESVNLELEYIKLLNIAKSGALNTSLKLGENYSKILASLGIEVFDGHKIIFSLGGLKATDKLPFDNNLNYTVDQNQLDFGFDYQYGLNSKKEGFNIHSIGLSTVTRRLSGENVDTFYNIKNTDDVYRKTEVDLIAGGNTQFNLKAYLNTLYSDFFKADGYVGINKIKYDKHIGTIGKKDSIGYLAGTDLGIKPTSDSKINFGFNTEKDLSVEGIHDIYSGSLSLGYSNTKISKNNIYVTYTYIIGGNNVSKKSSLVNKANKKGFDLNFRAGNSILHETRIKHQNLLTRNTEQVYIDKTLTDSTIEGDIENPIVRTDLGVNNLINGVIASYSSLSRSTDVNSFSIENNGDILANFGYLDALEHRVMREELGGLFAAIQYIIIEENGVKKLSSVEIISGLSFESAKSYIDGIKNFNEINPENIAPTIEVESILKTNEDISKDFRIITNDIDGTVDSIEVIAGNGTIIDNGNGNFSYIPTLNFNGTDTIEIRATDNEGLITVKLITVTVDSENDIPTITTESTLIVTEDISKVFSIDVSDVDGTASLEVSATNGVVIDNGNTTFTYTSNLNYNGSATITVTATDNEGLEITKLINVTVESVNDKPIATTTSIGLNEDTISSGTLTGSDIEGDNLTYIKVNDVLNGVLTLNSDGTYEYTPEINYDGTVIFTYKVNDGKNDSEAEIVTITINGIDDAPTISGFPTISVDEGKYYSFIPEANDIDSLGTGTFSVKNLPYWATFNTSTGEVSGLLGYDNGGLFTGIEISHTIDGKTAILPSFDLTVNDIDLPNATSFNYTTDFGYITPSEQGTYYENVKIDLNGDIGILTSLTDNGGGIISNINIINNDNYIDSITFNYLTGYTVFTYLTLGGLSEDDNPNTTDDDIDITERFITP